MGEPAGSRSRVPGWVQVKLGTNTHSLSLAPSHSLSLSLYIYIWVVSMVKNQGWGITVSKLQTVVTLSTTEAEYMAVTHACKVAIWIQRLFEELRHKEDKIYVYCDS